MLATKTSCYTPEQRALIAEIGRAAALMGLKQDDAAKRATEVLGINVSQSSVSRCVLSEPAVAAAAKEEPETLFDFANLTAAEKVSTTLDAILDELKYMNREKRDRDAALAKYAAMPDWERIGYGYEDTKGQK